ncbi:MAG: RIP metalloprotease RseP [Gammaproteobacteria bacterium]|nr:RIP metalloprotease RseP [Gammaproteobacteria bacterium]MCH9763745.1 RIP metalloprotease RseP [Gammaproteobacteria bacterium]
MFWTLFYFTLALFLLVTIHEAGHFFVARWCGVKVLRFSFGFGPVLFSKRDKKGTVFAWSLIPLGGYVKFLGEADEALNKTEREFAFSSKPLISRAAIILAGPLFNFLLAFIAFWCVSIIGMTTLAPIVDEVSLGSVAKQVGFIPQDEIVAINGKSVASWHDVRYALMPYMGGHGVLDVWVVSRIDGVTRGLHVPLGRWATPSPDVDPIAALGLTPFMPKILPRVAEVFPNTPAKTAGLHVGDEVLDVDAHGISDWRELVIYVKNHPNKKIILNIKRGQSEKHIAVQLGHQLKAGKQEGTLGVLSERGAWPKDLVRKQHQDPLRALVTASKQTWLFTEATVVWIGRMITGDMPVKNLSGPLGIAQGASDSARGGLVYYLSFLGLVSIGLGVLNLLPIPILDGGQLMYALIEGVTGRPVSEHFKTVGVVCGLILMMALTAVALRNDVIRLVGS